MAQLLYDFLSLAGIVRIPFIPALLLDKPVTDLPSDLLKRGPKVNGFGIDEIEFKSASSMCTPN